MPNWCYNHLKIETSDPWTDTDEEKDKIVEKDRKELAKFKKENFKDLGEDNDTQVKDRKVLA